MASVRISIHPDRAKWDRTISAQFRTFNKVMDAGVRKIASQLDTEVDAVVNAGRQRPGRARPGRGDSQLAEAIKASIAPLPHGIRVTDIQTLNRIATYWHAIEVGSNHIIGLPVRAFGRRAGGVLVNTSPPDAARFRLDPDMAPGRRGGPGPVVTNPITAHGYLTTISNRATSLMNREVQANIQKVLS